MLQSFDEENVDKYAIVNTSYLIECGIRLDKILANDIHFTKFATVFPCQNFALYGKTLHKFIHGIISRLL